MKTTNIGDLIEIIPDNKIWPDQTNKEQLNRLQKALPIALENLSAKQQLYLRSYFYDNLTVTETAKLYNIAPSTVSRTIARGKKKLKTILQFAL